MNAAEKHTIRFKMRRLTLWWYEQDNKGMIHCLTGAFQSADVTPPMCSIVCCHLPGLNVRLPASFTSLKLWDFLLRFLSTNSILRAERWRGRIQPSSSAQSNPVHQHTGSLITDKLIKSSWWRVKRMSINNNRALDWCWWWWWRWWGGGWWTGRVYILLRGCSFMM